MKAVALELYKLRRKRLLPMTVLFLGVEIAWAFAAAARSMARQSGPAGWEPVLAALASMNGLFLPILTAVCVSRICDMEHKGNTWKLLYTLSVRRSGLYAAKFAAAAAVMLAACLVQTAAVAVFGISRGFGPPLPFALLARFFAGAALPTLVIIALQQWVSMAAKNQTFALALGMIGGFIGLAADFLPQGAGAFFVWAYYTGLSPVVVDYGAAAAGTGPPLFTVTDAGASLAGMAWLSAAGAILCLAGNLHVSRREV